MISALTPHRRAPTKRSVIYSGCVSVLLLAAVLFGFHGGLQAPKNIPSKSAMYGVSTQIQPRLVASYGKLPLSFEVNQGQTDPQVKFLSRGRGYTLFLAANEAVLAVRKPSAFSPQLSASQITGSESWSPMEESGRLLALPGRPRRTKDSGRRTTPLIQNPRSKIENQVVRLRLVGASRSAEVTGSDELPGKANYFIGNDPKKWRTNVPTYAKVRYQNVYPGVDLEYYGNQGGQLEYDFIVAPGADPGAIALDVAAHGHAPMRIVADGDLVISTEGGEVRFHKPVVYQPTSGQVQRTTDDGRRTATNPKSKIQNRLRSASFSTPRIAFTSRWALTTTPRFWSSTLCWFIPRTWAAALTTAAQASR